MKLAEAYVEIKAKTSKFNAALGRVHKRLKKAQVAMEAMAKTAKKVFLVSAAAIGALVYAAMKFEKQLAMVSTMLSGEGMKWMGAYEKGLQKLSMEFGESTATLSKGLYDILSASIAPAKAMEVLAIAAKAAVGGMTTTAVSADALTSILNAYGMEADKAQEVSDKLFATVKRGKLCVTGETRVLLSNGSYVRIDSLSGENEIVSWDGRNFTSMESKWVSLGTKKTLKLQLASGRQITTTPEHPYLTPSGWREVQELSVGEKIAVPVSLPFFGDKQPEDGWPTLLGYLISEGSLNQSSPKVSNKNPEVIEEIRESVEKLGAEISLWATDNGCETYGIKVQKQGGQKRNPIITQLRDWGLWGSKSDDKFVPDEVFQWNKKSLVIFIKALFNGDGWLCKTGSGFQLGYCSNSEQLIRDLSHLLLRFGIVGNVRQKKTSWTWKTKKQSVTWTWDTKRYADIRRFVDFIGIDRLAVKDVLEHECFAHLRGFIDDPKKDEDKKTYKPFPGKRDYTQPIFYDKIIAVVDNGEEKVYDLTVPILHNFVANDIIAHNTYAELAGSIGKAAATANLAGLSLDELLASISTITRAGISSDQAMTSVVGVLRSFLKPTGEGAKLAKSLGFELSTASLKALGFSGVMKKLNGLSAEQLSLLFPNIRGLKGIAAAMADTTGHAKDLTLMTNSAGLSQEAFSKMSETLSFQLGKLKQSVIVLAASFGNELIPAVDRASKRMSWFIKKTQELPKAIKTAVAEILVWTVSISGFLIVLGKMPKVIKAITAGLILVKKGGIGLFYHSITGAIKAKAAIAALGAKLGVFAAILGGPVVIALAAGVVGALKIANMMKKAREEMERVIKVSERMTSLWSEAKVLRYEVGEATNYDEAIAGMEKYIALKKRIYNEMVLNAWANKNLTKAQNRAAQLQTDIIVEEITLREKQLKAMIKIRDEEKRKPKKIPPPLAIKQDLENINKLGREITHQKILGIENEFKRKREILKEEKRIRLVTLGDISVYELQQVDRLFKLKEEAINKAEKKSKEVAVKEKEVAAKEIYNIELGWGRRLERAKLGFIEDKTKRQIALIKEAYEYERKEAKKLGLSKEAIAKIKTLEELEIKKVYEEEKAPEPTAGKWMGLTEIWKSLQAAAVKSPEVVAITKGNSILKRIELNTREAGAGAAFG